MARKGVGKSKTTIRCLVPLDSIREAESGVAVSDRLVRTLADDIRETGLLLPLPAVVDAGAPNTYRLRCGGLRLRALRELRTTDPVWFEQSFADGVEVELQVDLDRSAQILAIRQLMDLGLKQGEVADELGCTQPDVSQKLKEYGDKAVWDDLKRGRISEQEALTRARDGRWKT